MAAMLLIIWLIYKVTGKALSKRLTWLHVILTLASVGIFLSFPLISNLLYTPIRTYSFKDFGVLQKQQALITIMISFFFIGQLLFLINLTVTAIKHHCVKQ